MPVWHGTATKRKSSTLFFFKSQHAILQYETQLSFSSNNRTMCRAYMRAAFEQFESADFWAFNRPGLAGQKCLLLTKDKTGIMSSPCLIQPQSLLCSCFPQTHMWCRFLPGCLRGLCSKDPLQKKKRNKKEPVQTDQVNHTKSFSVVTPKQN